MGFVIILVSSAVIFLLMVVRLVLTKKSRARSSGLEKIPGPRRLPLIGNLHHLAGRNPLAHRTFRDLAAKHGPLMKLELGEVPWLIVSSVGVARQVMRTHDVLFCNRPRGLLATAMSYNYTDLGMAPYGDHWRHLRKISALELLSAKRVRSFRAIRQRENLGLAGHIAGNSASAVDLSLAVYLLSFEITTQATIGRKTDRAITSAISDILKTASLLGLADLYPSSRLLQVVTGMNSKVVTIFGQADAILESIMKQLREADGAESVEDLGHVLLKHQTEEDELPLTDETIKGVILNMFIAGSDTSATVVEWAMSELVRNPALLEKATSEVRSVMDGDGYVDESKFEELPFLKLVVKETLRLHPPLPFLVPRMNSHACEIDGYEIPAETRLMVNVWALARDPNHWGRDADEFNPDRFRDSSLDYRGNDLEYIPFSSGRRICPGMNFGVANVEFTLATLLYHFDWGMPGGLPNRDLDMTESFGVTVKRKNHLMLLPTLRRPLISAPP